MSALLLITAGYASAQDTPSHTQLNPAPSSGFDFPAQLTLFGALAAYSNGIIVNVTNANFSNANAQLANYNATIDTLSTSAPNTQGSTVMDAMKASRDDFSAFIKNAQRYNDLYVNETVLSLVAARSNGSIANALEMGALNATLKGLQSTIEGRNADIYGVAVDNGLNLSQNGNSTALFKAYATQTDSRLANVTAVVFQTPTLTLAGSKNNATYGDAIVLAGSLRNIETATAVNNSSVDVQVDGATVATVSTNATGSYAYRLPIRTIAPGKHVAAVKYDPVNVPYNPAQSPSLNFSVAKSPVTNTLSFLSGSIALGSDLQARGRLTTPNGPVTNATVMFTMGDKDVAQTQTDQNGTYSFSAPTTGNYFPAVFGGTTAYTVFDPNGQPLDRTVSATALIPADLTAVYGIIAAITLAVVLSFLLYFRWYARRAPSAKPVEAKAPPARVRPAEPETVQAPTPVPLAVARPEQVIDWNAVREQARGAFIRGDDEAATITLFDAAVGALSASANVRLAAHMTHWEKFWALQAAKPDASAPLRELTTAYELINYGDRSLTQEQRDAAIRAFESVRGLAKSAEGHQ